MRKTPLAVLISSVLLGAVAAQAEPTTVDPSQQDQQAQATAPSDTSQPATTPTAPDADAGTNTNNPDVGAPRSNVDEDSSSGSYYPYSAGTVGDDPSDPKSTAAPPDTGAKPAAPTDQWGDADADRDGYVSQAEMTKVAPDLAPSFGEMDVDSDGKLTRGEFRTWHESHKAKMDADQGLNSTSAGSPAPSTTTSPDSTGTAGDHTGTAEAAAAESGAMTTGTTATTSETTSDADTTSSSSTPPDSTDD